MSGTASSERARVWFVQAAGKVWGPYSDARLEDFVAEGRVAAATLVGASAEGPFLPAARQARLHRLFAEAEPDRGEAVEAESAEPKPRLGLDPARPLLVWAELESQSAGRFEQALAVYGPFVRIGAGLWLLRTRLGPAALRNALTRRLGAGDALMAVEADPGHAAWFNLEAETDRSLRQLWTRAAED